MPDAPQKPERSLVERPNRGKRDFVKPFQRLCNPESHRKRPLNGHRFRCEFAENDVEKSDDGKGDDKRDGVLKFRRGDVEPMHRRFEKLREGGFTEPAKAEAGERDTELRRAEGRIEITDDALCDLCATITLNEKWLKLGSANFYNGEFCRDKEAVQKDEERHQQHLQDDFQCLVHLSPGELRQKLL